MKKLNKLIFIQDLVIPLTVLIVLIVSNIIFYNGDLYIVFTKVETLGLLWTIVGFAFTIHCFILPRLSKTIRVLKRTIKLLGDNFKQITAKEYLKLKRNEQLISLLKVLLFGVLSFLIILTFCSLQMGTLSKSTIILINITSNLILTMTSLSYLIIFLLAGEQFEVENGLDDETLEELNNSVKKMESWAKEEKTDIDLKEKENGKDEDAK